MDRSESIRESVHDVKLTLLLTIALVIAVIFVFLRSFTATIIPSLTLPVSIIATFGVMYVLDYSLDNLSLMALTLCIGFVVDDTIVMLENIGRHMEMGKPAMRAAFEGAKEVEFTIIAMTASLVAVFIPILFMGGIVGRLLQEFAVTIGVAILVSCFVSISLTPMLCSRFLKTAHGKAHGRLYNFTERMFDASLHGYDVSLQFALRHRAVTMALSFLFVIGAAYLFVIVPKGFLPTEDQGRFQVSVEAIQGIGFEEMVRHQQEVAAILAQDPDIAGSSSSVGDGGGRSGGSSSNQGRVSVDLKPRHERDALGRSRSWRGCGRNWRRCPASACSWSINRQSTSAGWAGLARRTSSRSRIRIRPSSIARRLLFEDEMRKIEHIEDVNSDLRLNNPQVQINLNRDRIAALGLTVNQVETALFNAYGTRQVSQIYASSNQYAVILQVAPEFQQDPAALSMLYVRSSNGKLIPLNTVASVTSGVGPLSVSHSGQLPSVNLSFNLKPGHALGDAVNAIEEAARTTLPSTVTTKFQGTAQAFQESLQGLGLVLVMAIVVIYIVLGILYESFTQPLVILSGLPAAGLRRADHPDAVQDRPQPVRLRRHHHARRPREEERHHDGRLRVGRRARARQDAARGDPRSVSRALPADHDDDDVRAGRDAADCARTRRGRRVAASARTGGRRRPARLAVPDAVHHAGVLRLHRGRAAAARQAARRRRRTRWKRPSRNGARLHGLV